MKGKKPCMSCQLRCMTSFQTPVCGSLIRLIRNGHTCLAWRAFHNTCLSTKSNTAFMSMQAACRRLENSQCSSKRSCRARMVSAAKRPSVNPDCCERCCLCSSDCSLPRITRKKAMSAQLCIYHQLHKHSTASKSQVQRLTSLARWSVD